ncbi:hypothetical protein TSUD_283590 [Trifolium subterraneum]|uniref:Cysteine-rich receptor-like protein kinase n=1 Tax=Trifolium subterraneum TaxID=3900 RepID=A0A2Z6P3X7_TRISU|nr:hypothetical protein TSUD_283590 [Trifolium subterraneum]
MEEKMKEGKKSARKKKGRKGSGIDQGSKGGEVVRDQMQNNGGEDELTEEDFLRKLNSNFVSLSKFKTLSILLQLKLKAWHKVEFGGGEERIAELIGDIKDLDIRGELVGLSKQEVISRKVLFQDLWRRLRSKDIAIFQSSRSKWLCQGDANTKFFHRCVASRGNLNSLMALQVGDVWLESPLLIREAVVNYFEVLFSSIQRRRPLLNGVQFPLLSEAENLLLARPFSDAEISDVVSISDGNKSPDPDGFNFVFLKNCWDTIKGEVRIMFDQFHGNASLPKSFLSYFVALIPKIGVAQTVISMGRGESWTVGGAG